MNYVNWFPYKPMFQFVLSIFISPPMHSASYRAQLPDLMDQHWSKIDPYIIILDRRDRQCYT